MASVRYRARLNDGLLDDLLSQLAALLVIGPRAAGKSTTCSRRAKTVIELDRDTDAAAFKADPDVALRSLDEPVLLDEWQDVPEALGAVRRAVQDDPSPNRFMVTGSVRAELESKVWPGTGRLQRLTMWPMTVRERLGRLRGPTFFDKVAAGEPLEVPRSAPDLAGYVDLAMQGGFPNVALLLSGKARRVWLESYIDDLLTHDIPQLDGSRGRPRDIERLRQYFDAYALNSAGVIDHKRLYDAAGITRDTALAYEKLLTDLFVIENIPAWTSNRLRRMVHREKRYIVEPSLITAALGLDAKGLIRDGDLLGRMIDSFVTAQLRPELALSETRPRLCHLRTKEGRQEVDLLAELAGDRVVGMEIKASASPNQNDARHLAWLRDELGSRFVAGVVFHTGPRLYSLDERLIAAPIAALWG